MNECTVSWVFVAHLSVAAYDVRRSSGRAGYRDVGKPLAAPHAQLVGMGMGWWDHKGSRYRPVRVTSAPLRGRTAGVSGGEGGSGDHRQSSQGWNHLVF